MSFPIDFCFHLFVTFFFRRDGVSSSYERESLAFTFLFRLLFLDSDGAARGELRLLRSSSGFSLHSFQVVHASLFFFFQIKVHELYHVLCLFFFLMLYIVQNSI